MSHCVSIDDHLFQKMVLHNRLGQLLELNVYHCQHSGRDYIFILAPIKLASSIVGKNAEPIAFELREKFALDPRRLELIEVRDAVDYVHFVRWPFEWAGNSPVSVASEEIKSPGLRANLLALISPPVISLGASKAASA